MAFDSDISDDEDNIIATVPGLDNPLDVFSPAGATVSADTPITLSVGPNVEDGSVTPMSVEITVRDVESVTFTFFDENGEPTTVQVSIMCCLDFCLQDLNIIIIIH